MPRDSLTGNILALGQQLRGAGLDIHTGRVLDAIDALPHINLAQRDEVYHTLRTLLVHRRDDFGTFDRVFSRFFSAAPPAERSREQQSGAASDWKGLETAGIVGANDEDAPASAAAVRAWSDVERIASKDFASLNARELAVARAAIDRLAWTPGVRRTRRWRPGRGPRIDLRRALAGSLRTGGEITVLPRRRRRTRQRPLVLLCDVSGSMEHYSRTLLHFAHALSRRHRHVESFLFSTRLTRITMALRTSRADAAITAASRSVHDWSGGTRIGSALRTVQQRWRRALHGGPIVMLISDGWDRGDPTVLRDEIARLRRMCHRLIWLNPLLGTVDYAPLTQGLQAALPFVDDFLPVRTLRDVQDLTGKLEGLRA